MRSVFIAALALGLVGCAPANPYSIADEPDASPSPAAEGVRVWTDPKTGCEYLIINNGYGAAMTPRVYNHGGNISAVCS